jgi:hypothetical protein
MDLADGDSGVVGLPVRVQFVVRDRLAPAAENQGCLGVSFGPGMFEDRFGQERTGRQTGPQLHRQFRHQPDVLEGFDQLQLELLATHGQNHRLGIGERREQFLTQPQHISQRRNLAAGGGQKKDEGAEGREALRPQPFEDGHDLLAKGKRGTVAPDHHGAAVGPTPELAGRRP